MGDSSEVASGFAAPLPFPLGLWQTRFAFGSSWSPDGPEAERKKVEESQKGLSLGWELGKRERERRGERRKAAINRGEVKGVNWGVNCGSGAMS